MNGTLKSNKLESSRVSAFNLDSCPAPAKDAPSQSTLHSGEADVLPVFGPKQRGSG
jgi:hypothetical protein